MGEYFSYNCALQEEILKLSVQKPILSPKITVVMFLDNNFRRVKSCLLSLINQSLKEIEIIIPINDVSKDLFSMMCVFESCDLRVKFIDELNSLMDFVTNGECIIKSDYIYFIDSSKIYNKNYFQKLYDSANKNSCFALEINKIKNVKFYQKNMLYWLKK